LIHTVEITSNAQGLIAQLQRRLTALAHDTTGSAQDATFTFAYNPPARW